VGYLGGYTEVHCEVPMKIYSHIVSLDVMTLVVVKRSRSFDGFTCFGVVGVEWWFYDLLLIKLNFKTS